MKNLLFPLFLSTVLLSCDDTSQNSDGVYDVSLLEQKTEMTFTKDFHDFGEITEGEVVSTEFEFENTGDADLIITQASAPCGCTVPSYPKHPIAPGEKGVIKVEFNSEGKPANQHKKVTVIANTEKASNIVAIRAFVKTSNNLE